EALDFRMVHVPVIPTVLKDPALGSPLPAVALELLKENERALYRVGSCFLGSRQKLLDLPPSLACFGPVHAEFDLDREPRSAVRQKNCPVNKEILELENRLNAKSFLLPQQKLEDIVLILPKPFDIRRTDQRLVKGERRDPFVTMFLIFRFYRQA